MKKRKLCKVFPAVVHGAWTSNCICNVCCLQEAVWVGDSPSALGSEAASRATFLFFKCWRGAHSAQSELCFSLHPSVPGSQALWCLTLPILFQDQSFLSSPCSCRHSLSQVWNAIKKWFWPQRLFNSNLMEASFSSFPSVLFLVCDRKCDSVPTCC